MITPGLRKTSDRETSRVQALHLSALVGWLASLFLFWRPLGDLVRMSFQDENSSHVLLIPVISAVYIYVARRRIFSSARYCPTLGVPLLVISGLLWYSSRTFLFRDADRVSAQTLLIVLAWHALFILCYGPKSFRTAIFPLLFLVLMIPLPGALTEHLVSFLQRGSAELCYDLFQVLGVPVLRHGFLFSLPGIDIEVAEQCSGIHSAISLFIAGLLAAQIILESSWRKIVFIFFILPIAIFKNAVRIVTIAWLGIHVSPRFFSGQLHRRGGLAFAIVSLAIMAALLVLLKHRPPARPSSPKPIRSKSIQAVGSNL